ncbi:MAG: hypothetical protein U0795_22180 [Pirellulales bacterium]
MRARSPIYTADNCRFAYQLNWGLTVFAVRPMPSASETLGNLSVVTEPDGVRILDYRWVNPRTIQFWLSTQPACSPAKVVQSVKGRWQYLLRDRFPKAFQRNYRIVSVGEIHEQTLQRYVSIQPDRHEMADLRSTELISRFQYHNEHIDLGAIQRSNSGEYQNNIHLVLKNADQLVDIHPDRLEIYRSGIQRICAKKGYRLSRVGIAANHMHMLLGCNVTDQPSDVALSMMNNLAWLQGQKRMFQYGAFLGTFGNYDRDAIRLRSQR